VNPQLRPNKAPFGIAIFLSAFLLFWVQLLLGKFILPWFGGVAAVWTTCMLFFQVLLLGGYAYAHLVSSRLASRAQGLLHCAVVLSSLLLLGCLAILWNSPITPGSKWKPLAADQPIIQIVTLLSVSVGLPYLILDTNKKNKDTARSCAVMTYCALVGAIGMARAVSDEELSREILKTAALRLKNLAA
jgi:glucan phosphoethanolaminetransferase (alkaline phosphatase superfamily)